MPGDVRLKASTRKAFGKTSKRAWNKTTKVSRASAALQSAPPDSVDQRDSPNLPGTSAELPADGIAGPSCSNGRSSSAGRAERVERSEQCKQALSGKSATQRKFDLLGVNVGSQASDAGTDFVVVDMKVLNDFFAQAKCGSCGAGPLTLTKAEDKEYGLAVKLVLVCATCEFEKKQFSSPRVAGTANITPFEVNMRALKGMQSIGKGVTALADFCACINLSHRGLHHKTFQGHLKTKLVQASEASATASEAASAAVVKTIYAGLLNPVGNIDDPRAKLPHWHGVHH